MKCARPGCQKDVKPRGWRVGVYCSRRCSIACTALTVKSNQDLLERGEHDQEYLDAEEERRYIDMLCRIYL